MAKIKLSRAKFLDLQQEAKFNMPLTDIQKKEFEDLADGWYNEINENRQNAGELPLYETRETIPTLADLEFIRELNPELV